MQLLTTSLNLRSDLSWEMAYEDCVYAWIAGSTEPRTRKKVYASLLRKLPQRIDFKNNPDGKFLFAGDYLEYESFIYDGIAYLGFTFVYKDTGRTWKTRIAFKKNNDFVVSYVSLDCNLERTSYFPEIRRPKIIDYLLKFKDRDGSIDISGYPHIIENTDILEARNVLTGKMGNTLPVVYLSCSEKSHALKPKIVAEQMEGVAHVYAERDKTIYDRLKIDMDCENVAYPKRGEIGVCYVGKPTEILNKYEVVEWTDHPELLVQDIFLQILKTNLSLKFCFTWDSFLENLTLYKRQEAERERIAKMESMDALRKEWREAKDESAEQSKLVKKLMSELEKVTAERDQYKDEHAQYAALYKKYENAIDEAKTWESLAVEEEKKRKAAIDELGTVKADLHDKTVKADALHYNMNAVKDKHETHLPLLMPKNKEMYDNEYMCQLVYILYLANLNIPKSKTSTFNRTGAIIEEILEANPEARETYKEYCAKVEAIISVAEREALTTGEGAKVLKPFDLVSDKSKHIKFRFARDIQGKFTGSEASTGSDSAHGGKNEARDLCTALFWRTKVFSND